MSVIWLPKASPLFIDKLSMTLAIPDNEQQTVIKLFQNYLSEYYGGTLYSNKLYYLNKKIYEEGKGQILFQCRPKSPNTNFFRIEWNPAKVETESVSDIVNSLLPDGYGGLVSYGRVTRIDITTDVKHLQMPGCLFYYPGMMVQYNYLKAGGIQTAYLGGVGGANQFRFYDKAKQIKKSNADKPKQYKEPLPNKPVTRIEWQHRPGQVCTLSSLYKTCGPIYQKLWCGMVAQISGQPQSSFESLVHLVIRLSRYEGLPQALAEVDKQHRANVRKFIEKNTYTSWWSPEKLWETFPGAIEHIMNPPPNKWANLSAS